MLGLYIAINGHMGLKVRSRGFVNSGSGELSDSDFVCFCRSFYFLSSCERHPLFFESTRSPQ